MQSEQPTILESTECEIIRETLKSLDSSLQYNTDQLNELLCTAPIDDISELLTENEDDVCIPDKIRAEKWYRNILKQLKGGRNVMAVHRQLMIVCQSYGFSLPPAATRETTLKPTISLFNQSMEIHDLIHQIYGRISKYYCEELQTATNQDVVLRHLIALSYVMDPYLIFGHLQALRKGQLNAQLPPITTNSDLLVFYTRISSLLRVTKDMIVKDFVILLSGIFREVSEPNVLIKVLYLDRLTKELIASFQQLQTTNQLGSYFCDIADQCYRLEQDIEHLLDRFCGLSILEPVHSDDPNASLGDTAETLWNWRLSVFAQHTGIFIEKVKTEKQELLSFLDETTPEFWLKSTCKGDCVPRCRQYERSVSNGAHSVLCRLVKYCEVMKHLGCVADYISPQISEDADSGSCPESLSDVINSLVNEVVLAVIRQASQLSDKVPDSRTLVDLYTCFSSLDTLNTVAVLPLTTATRTTLQTKIRVLRDQICLVNDHVICDTILHDEGVMCWNKNHTIEIKECSPSIISLNLYLRALHYDTQHHLHRDAQHHVISHVLEHSLTFLTRRYLDAKPSATNTKLFRYDITAIVMIYSSFVWLLGENNVAQDYDITEPTHGSMMVIYSNLNRLLAVMSVVTSPLELVVASIKHFTKLQFPDKLRDRSVSESESVSCQSDCHSPVLPHSHTKGESGIPVSWSPSVWLSTLFSIDNLDPSLIHTLRCFNNLTPSKRDILLTALCNCAKIPQNTQLYHSRDTSAFAYNTVVLTMSRLLSCSKYDSSAWAHFILTTFIPNEIWNSISKPDFRLSKDGKNEEFWQECIGEVLLPALKPILTEAVNLTIYRYLPSTEEEIAIEELPCACRINRYTPSLKLVLHEVLKAVFLQLSFLVPHLPPCFVKLVKLLCYKAKLKENSELAVLKIMIVFFLKRLFTNPNGICTSGYKVPEDCTSITKYTSTPELPFTDLSDESLIILRKIGDTVRLIVMNDVYNIIKLPSGVQKFLKEESEFVSRCLESFGDQLDISLQLRSEMNIVQLDYDIEYIDKTYPGIFHIFLDMIQEVTDVISKDISGFLKSVQILPIKSFNPLEQFKNLGSFTLDDVSAKVWNYDRLSEYHSSDLLLRYLPSRWEVQDGAVLPKDKQELVDILKMCIAKNTCNM